MTIKVTIGCFGCIFDFKNEIYPLIVDTGA